MSLAVILLKLAPISQSFICLMSEISYFVVYCQPEVLYAHEGDTIRFICPFMVQNGHTSWIGPPNFSLYMLDGVLNPNANRLDRLLLLRNNDFEVHDLQIKNLSKTVDEGEYRCELALNASILKKLYQLKFYSKF